MLYDLIYTFLLLICFHFLCDYPLQGDYIAKYKSRIIDGKINPIWKHCMSAHCAIHSLPILLLSGSILLALIMFISHLIIDYLKCQNKIDLNIDQLLHFIVIFNISYIIVVF